nr:hypothetical protein [Pseudomonas aeruginosa]
MGHHSEKDVQRLIERLQERHDKLVKVMTGRSTQTHTASGSFPALAVNAEDIRFAVDDLATALKEIRSRRGKG